MNVNKLKRYLENNKTELATIGIVVEQTLVATTVFMGSCSMVLFENSIVHSENGKYVSSDTFENWSIFDLLHKTSAPQNVEIHNEIKAIIQGKTSKDITVDYDSNGDMFADQDGKSYLSVKDALVANEIYFQDTSGIIRDCIINDDKLSISLQVDGFRASIGRYAMLDTTASKAIEALEVVLLGEWSKGG